LLVVLPDQAICLLQSGLNRIIPDLVHHIRAAGLPVDSLISCNAVCTFHSVTSIHLSPIECSSSRT
jgi:hypothetical protein